MDPALEPAWGRVRKQAAGLVSEHRIETTTIAVLLLALMWAALPREIQGGDAGEFATVMLRGGVPHPSGYPWMRLLGLAARLFEGAGVAPATAAALPCALAGVAAWIVLHRLLCSWGRPRTGGFFVLLAASSPVVVLHVNDSEVWGPSLFFAALVLRAALHRRPDPMSRRTRPLWLGLTLGLAVSHHLTSILLLPLVVAAAWPQDKTQAQGSLAVGRRWQRLLGAGGLGLLGSLVGLTPFLSLALGEGGVWRWGNTRTAAGLIHHVTRADYGVTSLSLHAESPALIDLWSRSLGSLGEAFSAGLLGHPIAASMLLIVTLIAAVVAARREGPHRVDLGLVVGLGGTLIATTLAFPAVHNIDPRGPFGAWILERFDLLAVALWTPIFALGAGFVLDRIRPKLRLSWLPATLAVVLLAGQGLSTLGRGLPHNEAGVERYATDLLRTPEPHRRAIVIGTDDHRTFPLLFIQEVRGLGPNVLYVDAQLLDHAWYRARLRENWPELPDADRPLRLIGKIWRSETLADTPIYLANLFSAPAARLQLVPEGLLLRVIPPATSGGARPDLSPQAVATRHLAALSRYGAAPHDFDGIEHPRGHPWSADLWHHYVDGSRQLAARLRQPNQPDWETLKAQATAIEARLFELTGAPPVP